jgi:hypothetical protein
MMIRGRGRERKRGSEEYVRDGCRLELDDSRDETRLFLFWRYGTMTIVSKSGSAGSPLGRGEWSASRFGRDGGWAMIVVYGTRDLRRAWLARGSNRKL